MNFLEHLIPPGVRDEVERVVKRIETEWDALLTRLESLERKVERILEHMEPPDDER